MLKNTEATRIKKNDAKTTRNIHDDAEKKGQVSSGEKIDVLSNHGESKDVDSIKSVNDSREIGAVVEINDLFSINGNPVPIYLEKSDVDKVWVIKFIPLIDGASAKVPFKGGSTMDIIISVKEEGFMLNLNQTNNMPEVRPSIGPDKKQKVGIISKNLYGERFRMIFAMSANVDDDYNVMVEKNIYFEDEK